MKTGRILTIINEKGFGFIESDSGDVFFHANQVRSMNFEDLRVGMTVEYVASKTEKGVKADNITVKADSNYDSQSATSPVGQPKNKDKHKILLKQFTESVWRSGPTSPRTQSLRLQFEEQFPDYVHKLSGAENQGIRKFDYKATIKQRENLGLPASSLKDRGTEHAIQKLSPSASWELLIDETGAQFEDDGNNQSKKGKGKVVAVLLGDNCAPAELTAGSHFVDLTIEQRDNVLQQLLDEPVGIFGLTIDEVPPSHGSRWVDSVIYTIKWCLRLLPIDGPTHVAIQIEQRGVHSAEDSNWEALLRQIMQDLLESNANRYTQLKSTIQIIQKNDSPYLADAVAHTWGSDSPDATSRLKQSGLVGSCLLQGNAINLMRSWDVLKQGNNLDGEQWQLLLNDADQRHTLSISAVLLDQIAAACRDDVSLWNRYFDATQSHVESKSIDLQELIREVNWLKTCQPEQHEFPKLLELVWLTAQLELSNHIGNTSDLLQHQIAILSDELYEEYSQVVCQADLVCAVLATNNFEFDHATAIIKKWRDVPVAVSGKKHWGRLQSSAGQHAAFTENYSLALEYFTKAIDAFSELSDVETAQREISQTAVYRAIASIDDPDSTTETTHQFVNDTVSLDLFSIAEISATHDPADKYRHHLLLRYLVKHGTAAERDAYLESQDLWDVGTGHPWALIECYRGELLIDSDRQKALQIITNAYKSLAAFDQGPTVQLIGLTIAAVGKQLGCEIALTADDFDTLRAHLPAAMDRIDSIVSSLDQSLDDPFTLLETVLPFNFR